MNKKFDCMLEVMNKRFECSFENMKFAEPKLHLYMHFYDQTVKFQLQCVKECVSIVLSLACLHIVEVEAKSKLGLENISHLHFYFHDLVAGKNVTAVEVALAPTTNSSATQFGIVRVMDDWLTEGPKANSKMVGRAQGIYVPSGQEVVPLLMVMTFVFQSGKYNGSTLSMLGMPQSKDRHFQMEDGRDRRVRVPDSCISQLILLTQKLSLKSYGEIIEWLFRKYWLSAIRPQSVIQPSTITTSTLPFTAGSFNDAYLSPNNESSIFPLYFSIPSNDEQYNFAVLYDQNNFMEPVFYNSVQHGVAPSQYELYLPVPSTVGSTNQLQHTPYPPQLISALPSFLFCNYFGLFGIFRFSLFLFILF